MGSLDASPFLKLCCSAKAEGRGDSPVVARLGRRAAEMQQTIQDTAPQRRAPVSLTSVTWQGKGAPSASFAEGRNRLFFIHTEEVICVSALDSERGAFAA